MTRLPPGHSQRTRTRSVESKPATAAQTTLCSRSGLTILSSSEPATMRGRCAVAYTTPVMSSRMNAATTDT